MAYDPYTLRVLVCPTTVDLTQLGVTELITLPNDFFITSFITKCVNFSGEMSSAAVNLGYTPDEYNDIGAGVSMGGFTQAGQMKGAINFFGGKLPANTPLNIKVVVNSVGPEIEEIEILICGFYV